MVQVGLSRRHFVLRLAIGFLLELQERALTCGGDGGAGASHLDVAVRA